MQLYRRLQFFPLICVFLFIFMGAVHAQGDKFPVREYTNPEEVVTFDRTTPFPRVLDVINEFAQKYREKIIIDRTNTQGNVGISIPAMHWMDALQLILRVKELQLVEKRDFYEIVKPQTKGSKAKQKTSGGGKGKAPIATTDTKEVRINAIFFEGNRRALNELGVDWSTISENTPAAVVDAGDDGASVPSSAYNGPFVQVNSIGASNVSQRVFDAIVNIGEIGNTGISVQSLFSAFEAENLGEILSSPNVKVMDGQSGRIQVGQDFSVKQRDFAGNVVEEFFSVGTILEVTPNIIEQNDTTFVHLNIKAERSSAQPDPVSTIINKQTAETQALLLDGQATVIAGLYRTEKSKVRRGVPILKDLPAWFFGLRYLFGYTSNDYLMRELVVLLQVTIEPTIPERVKDGVMTNRFKALQDERDRIRENVEQADKIFKGERISDNLDLKQADENEPIREEEEESPKKKEFQQKNIAKADTVKAPKPVTQEDEENKDTVITDPEIKNPKVELNLGSNMKQQESTKKSMEKVDKDMSETKDKELESTTSSNNKKQVESANYYIIGGSFSKEENAQSLRDKLQSKGFKAVLISKPNSEMTMVAYRGYESLGSAKTGLADIKQYQNEDAWLYKAK